MQQPHTSGHGGHLVHPLARRSCPSAPRVTAFTSNIADRSRHPFQLGLGTALCTVLTLLALQAPQRARANSEVLNIQPYIAVIVDTSGSMERLPSCTCSTASCSECLPQCNEIAGSDEKNRWAITLEALTGTIDNFACKSLLRTSGNGATYDLNYFLPYHQPWVCTGADPYCGADSADATFSQQTDGILDTYGGRVRFGLMTFDGWQTYLGQPNMVSYATFDDDSSRDAGGLWSYGSYTDSGANITRKNGSQPGRFHYPNCAVDYMIDTGIRGPNATEGGLISLNSTESTNSAITGCSTAPCDPSLLSSAIQETVLNTRPYGGTPIAAALDDLYYHINSDLGADSYGSCRNRYAMLITDGYPDDDFRAYGCDCTQNTDDEAAGYCGGGGNLPADMFCPYPLPEEIAADLVTGRVSGSDTDNPPIQQLFVVGLSIVDPAVKKRLDDIALAGGAELIDGNYALFADDNDPSTDDLEVLRQTIDNVVSLTIEPISRSVPVFVQGKHAPQYRISSGFEVGAGTGQPWYGYIERTRYVCSGSGVVEQTLEGEDFFHETLEDNASSRMLLSVSGGVDANESTLDDSCSSCSYVQDLSSISAEELGLTASETDKRLDTLAWMYGRADSPRKNWPLGDVYHSSPVVLESPQYDTTDPAYNTFRRTPMVADRPLTLFINSNDGILHAFAVEDWGPGESTTVSAGTEMWGFVPPMLLNDLPRNLSQHQMLLDGTPIVKDVYLSRSDSASTGAAADYRTVLVTGMRAGGSGYIALDVTNAQEPKFLWQFADNKEATPAMGQTYGQAALTQATYIGDSGEVSGGVAILPGGKGELGIGTGCISGSSTDTHPGFVDADGEHSFHSYSNISTGEILDQALNTDCWKDTGRSLYFVDVATGKLIKKIGPSVFPAPLIGTPSVFPADVGATGSRAFVADADGVLWRIDLSSKAPDPDDPMAGWTARPFHNFHYNYVEAAMPSRETTLEAPLVTTDKDGRVVVIAATGNGDDFEENDVQNRVVSLTEIRKGGGGTAAADNYRAVVNWEIMSWPSGSSGTAPAASFVESELVPGKMALQEGRLYIASYISMVDADPCKMGSTRFWSVDYLASEAPQSGQRTNTPVLIPTPGFNVDTDNAEEELLVLGLALVEQPSCVEVNSASGTFGNYTPSASNGPPATYLVAQSAGQNATKQDGSALKSITRAIPTPNKRAKLSSWAGSVE